MTVSPGPDLKPRPDDAPTPMAFHESSRVRNAAHRAKALYPGPVGELINRELLAWSDFGWRVGDHGLVNRLVDDVLKPRT